MANPYDQNYFGDSYYSFENNRNNGFQNTNRIPPQMRPQFAPKPDPNYGQQNDSYSNKSVGPVFNKTNDYYRRTNQPYFGQNRGPAGHQYRAQVIDYSSGPQSQSNYDSSPRMPSNRFPNNGQQFRY